MLSRVLQLSFQRRVGGGGGGKKKRGGKHDLISFGSFVSSIYLFFLSLSAVNLIFVPQFYFQVDFHFFKNDDFLQHTFSHDLPIPDICSNINKSD